MAAPMPMTGLDAAIPQPAPMAQPAIMTGPAPQPTQLAPQVGAAPKPTLVTKITPEQQAQAKQELGTFIEEAVKNLNYLKSVGAIRTSQGGSNPIGSLWQWAGSGNPVGEAVTSAMNSNVGSARGRIKQLQSQIFNALRLAQNIPATEMRSANIDLKLMHSAVDPMGTYEQNMSNLQTLENLYGTKRNLSELGQPKANWAHYGYADQNAALSSAQQALKNGADPAAVHALAQSMGLDISQLGK